MDKRSKYEGKLQKLALSCDSFTTGYLAMCLLFAVPYAAQYGGNTVLWFLPLACLIPFAVMPLVYMLVHRLDALLFGRYHLVMPLSAFISALFFVIAFSARSASPAGACAVFFGGTVFASSVTIYRYCAFSVRVRLVGDGIASGLPHTSAFAAFGGISALVAFFGFAYFDSTTAYLNTAYVLSAANVVFAMIVYFTTYYGIPKLGGRRVQSVKNIFRSFYVGLNKRTYFSSLLFICAFTALVMTAVFYAVAFGSYFTVLYAAATFVVCYAFSAVVCSRYITGRSLILSVINCACFFISACLLILCAGFEISSGTGLTVFISSACAVSGVGGGVAMRQARLRLLTVKPRITSGVVFIMAELICFAAVASALLLCAIINTVLSVTLSPTAFIYGFAFAALCAVAAFALAGKKSSKSARLPRASYERNAEEIERAVGATADDLGQ